MQRLPNHMRDMLSTRNPSDNWCREMAISKSMQDEYIRMYKGQASMIETLVLELGNNLDNTRERKVELMTVIIDAVNSLTHDIEGFLKKAD